jgi:hypothetical protein
VPGGAESLLVKVQSDRPQAGSVAEGGGNASLGAVERWVRWLRLRAVGPCRSRAQDRTSTVRWGLKGLRRNTEP